MSKICGSCGAQCDDTANVCGSCGAPFAAEAAPVAPVAPAAPASKPGWKKFIKPAIALILAIIVICGAFSIVGGFTAKGTAKKFMKAYIGGNASGMAKYFSQKLGEDKDERKDNAEKIAEIIEDAKDDYKFSWKVKKVESITGDKLEAIQDDMEKNYDVKVSKAAKVTVKLTAKEKDSGDSESRDVTLTLIKTGLSWKVYNLD